MANTSSEFNANFIKSAILRELTKQANEIAESARAKASTWSTRIPDAISVGSAKEESGRYTIEIIVDLNKAPHAAAFEYGSGEHAGGERYRIPREDNITWKMSRYGDLYVLAFPISRWPNYVPPPNVSVALFPGSISRKPYVMHPGVEKRPFLKPAVDEKRRTIRGLILTAVTAAYRVSVPKITFIGPTNK